MALTLHTCFGSLIAWLLVGLMPWKKPPPLAQLAYMLVFYFLIGYGVVLLWVS